MDASQGVQELQPSSRAPSGSIVSGSVRDPAKPAADALDQSSRGLFQRWMQSLVARSTGVGPAFEDVLHGFAEIIETEADPVIIESSLLRLVRQLAPATWVELVAGPSPAECSDVRTDVDGEESDHAASLPGRSSVWSGQSVLEIPLRCGRSVCGRLRIRPRARGSAPLRDDVIRRLTTLCTMAAGAFESLGRQAACCGDDDAVQSDSDCDQAAANDAWAAHPIRPSVLVQDATFLNAVLPFALNQAKRHRESLSLLCVAIDRLSSIQDLMGRAEVDRLVQHVGQTVSSLIRKSDIVARLDDDRIVAVLPRAPRGGALHVANNICRSVAQVRPDGFESPGITVSIGVATFPSCAANVYSLFDAADEALSWAQKQGRARAVLAPTLPTPTPVQTTACMP